MRPMRFFPLAVASATTLATGIAVAGLGLPAASAASRAGGPVMFFVTPAVNAPTGSVVITGAIGGRGEVLDVSKTYIKVVMQQGTGAGATFEVNLTVLDDKANTAIFPIDKQACTSEGSISASAPILDGTGSYEGLRGTARLTETLAWTMPRYSSGKGQGQCNGSQAVSFVSITGTGTVSFS
jgi:hypothetical protein